MANYAPEIPERESNPLGDQYWRAPNRQPESWSDWGQRQFLSGGGGDLRNLLAALPVARMASATGAAAPRVYSATDKAQGAGSVVQQVLKDWKLKEGQSPKSDSDWQRVQEMTRQRMAGIRRDRTAAMPQENPRDLMARAQGLGIQPSAQPAPQPAPPPGGGLGALLPGLLQAGQSGAFGGMAQQAKTGFDRFLDTNEEMGRYFLDL